MGIEMLLQLLRAYKSAVTFVAGPILLLLAKNFPFFLRNVMNFLVHKLSIGCSIPHLQFLFGFYILYCYVIHMVAILVSHQVLLQVILGWTYEHHPVT